MHEVGHNFGSGHTHDDKSYSPVIDSCGNICTAGLPLAGLPLANSATIMSYCHICAGGDSNNAYTFGGKYKGTGSRGDINSYDNSPLEGLGFISTEPRRVNVKMWQHVSSGTCTNVPPIGVTNPPVVLPTNPPVASPTNPPVAYTPYPTFGTTPFLGDWEQCSSSSQCMNGCCSGIFSGGDLICTPLVGWFDPNTCIAV